MEHAKTDSDAAASVTDPSRSTLVRLPVVPALTLMLMASWLLTHRYQGLAQDARIYAVQALARLHPSLGNDLYLQNTSQDRFTVFSPFYAQVIELLGLQNAARTLVLLFQAGFLAASWHAARALLGKEQAWLAVGTLILTVGAYGSYAVFHFSEDYLSARSAAEALIAAALAFYLSGYRRFGCSIAVGALLVHPLMALPGVLLLIFLRVSIRVAASLAVCGVMLTLLAAFAASNLPPLRAILPIMDAAWLEVVKERSQFLFLQLWSLRDWEVNVRPFATLALAAWVFTDLDVRKLCAAAACVGAAGLTVALVAVTTGPVALLVQGQAWRWVWVTGYVSTILMLSTTIRLWRNGGTGPVSAVLLIAAWTSTAFADHSPSLALGALGVQVLGIRFRVVANSNVAGNVFYCLKLSAVISGVALLGWELVHLMPTAPFAAGHAAGTPASVAPYAESLQKTSTIAVLRYPTLILFMALWLLIERSRSIWLTAGLSLGLGGACALLVPIAFARVDTAGAARDIAAFAEWRETVPPDANVYLADGHDASPLTWFTLQRPSYLSLDQSAGVVFSRATALEIKRRSLVLLPLMDEDWKLLSRNRMGARNRAGHAEGQTSAGGPPPRRTPLTAQSLVRLCRDPQFGFLIARENVGFDPLKHKSPGPLKDWNLYDCVHVRSVSPAI